MSTHPKVFISYSHDSKEHSKRVLELANRLRADGVDAILDQYEIAPTMGWPRWMQQEVEAADFVLVVASPTYKKRFEGAETLGTGRGVSWEGLILTQALYEASGSNKRIIPVVFGDAEAEAAIPTPLRPFVYLRLPIDYQLLLRQIYNQPEVQRPPLGAAPTLKPKSVGTIASGKVFPQLELRLAVNAEEARRRVTEIQKALRGLLGTDDVFITDIKEGSARLQVSGDPAAIARLEQLIRDNSISEVLGLKVVRLDRLEQADVTPGPPWLDERTLKLVFRTADRLGLSDNSLRITLLSGLPQKIQKQLPTAAEGAAQLLSDLRYLNKLARLADGTAAIQTWLETAELLKADFEDAAVFRQALFACGWT